MEKHIKVVLGLSCFNHVCKQALQQRRSVNMPGYYLLQRLQHLAVSLFVRSNKPQKSIFYHRQSRGKRCVFLYFYKLPQTLQALGCGPPSCTQGAVEQGGCWICCVMETWSLREAGWCQSPGDRQLWQSYQGVGCPQWWSDGLQHLRTSQLAAGPAGKHCVHSLPQRCSQAVN